LKNTPSSSNVPLPQVCHDPVQRKKRRRKQANRYWFSEDRDNFMENYKRSLLDGMVADWEYSEDQILIEEHIADKEDLGAMKIARPPANFEKIMDTNNAVSNDF
jgi:hypothetical protein